MLTSPCLPVFATINEGLQLWLSFIPLVFHLVVNHSFFFYFEIAVLNFYFNQKFLETAI